MLRMIVRRIAGFLPAAPIAAVALSPAWAEPIEAPQPLPLPIPRAALLDPTAEETADLPAAPDSVEVLLFEPGLAAVGRAAASSGAHLRARAPIPVDIIREGFAARADTAGPNQDRSVGFKLGKDVLSVQTTLSQPASPGSSQDARLSWKLAQPVAASTGFVWGASTGGNTNLTGRPEQTGDAVIGYRQRIFDHLTLTSQLGMAGSYIFAQDGGLHSALTPEMKLSVDLAKPADLPWQTSLDVSLARKLPLVASDYETRGTALISFKYQLQ